MSDETNLPKLDVKCSHDRPLEFFCRECAYDAAYILQQRLRQKEAQAKRRGDERDAARARITELTGALERAEALLREDRDVHGAAIPATRVGVDPAELARRFHEEYEALAPSFGWTTNAATACHWDKLPRPNRDLMVAAVTRALASPGTAAARLSPFEHDTTDGSGE